MSEPMTRLPTIDANGVPWCSYEHCPQYDGKRCLCTGFQPAAICEPAVRARAAIASAASTYCHAPSLVASDLYTELADAVRVLADEEPTVREEALKILEIRDAKRVETA